MVKSKLMLEEKRMTRNRAMKNEAVALSACRGNQRQNGRQGNNSSCNDKAGGKAQGARPGPSNQHYQSNQPNQSIKCYACHEFGHKKNRCPNWISRFNESVKREQQTKNQDYGKNGDGGTVSLLASITVQDCNRNKWYLDSAATDSMCNEERIFSVMRAAKETMRR